MAQNQINTCLKRIFTVFNCFFAIIGAIIILLTLLSQVVTDVNVEELEGRTSGLITLYVVGIVTLTIAVLGAYGANRENKVCLIIFLVCMVIGSLMMLRVGIVIATARPQVEGVLENKLRSLLPLDKASEDVRQKADDVQTNLQCCGLFSYNDWEENIPDSCLCSRMQEDEGLCQTVSYRSLFQSTQQRKTIFSKPCFPTIMHFLLMIINVVMGVFLTLGMLAVLGMILSSIMIHQMRHRSRATMLMTVPAIFTAQPPKYEELQNAPGY